MNGLLLDTDVVSEMMKPHPAPQVLAWLERHSPQSIFISAVSRAEIEYGVIRLPEGKRKGGLAAAAGRIFLEYDKRLLSFDKDCAAYFANAKYEREIFGARPENADMMIAAIALHKRLTLVTRNVRHFGGIGGLEIANPWEFRPPARP